MPSLEENWDELVVGGIYVVLFIRDDPPKPNDFHWGLYVHTEAKAGYKYHIKNMTNGWIADHARSGGVFKSLFLTGLFHIATTQLDKATFNKIDGIMKTYDSRLNTAGTTCRVWVLLILELLKSNGLLQCQDMKGLEQEVFDFGNRHASDAAKAKKPRPVGASTLCRL